MAETVATAVAVPSSPAKKSAPKPKKVKASGGAAKQRTHPPVQQMVREAIVTLKERNGSSLQAIKKYISAKYVPDVERIAPFIRKHLRTAVGKGQLIQSKGKGASGSFKLKKAAEKKEGATKPKKVVKKKTAGAAKPKKAAGSPKKAKAAKPKKAKEAGAAAPASAAPAPAAEKKVAKPKAAKPAKKAASPAKKAAAKPAKKSPSKPKVTKAAKPAKKSPTKPKVVKAAKPAAKKAPAKK